jgi:catechol 2,3-dioxygenase-like lactoylglutathione lyase family enzyme
MKVSLHHTGIIVPDLEKAAAFYKEWLGLSEHLHFDWDQSNDQVGDIVNLKDSAAKGVMLKGNGFRIELFEYSAPESSGDPASARSCDLGIRHIAFQFDDIDEAFQRLLDGGGSMHHEPVVSGSMKVIYCRDPFGNIVELMQSLKT